MMLEQWKEFNKSDFRFYLLSEPNATAFNLFEKFKLRFPVGYVNRRSDNPYWVALKSFVQEYKNQGM